MTKEEKARIIQEKREELGHTIDSAANEMKISREMYGQIESGFRIVDNLSVHSFLTICNVLDLDPMLFLDTY